MQENFPNPFQNTTRISYRIPERTNVELKVFNNLGQEVATLVNHKQNPGEYTVLFEATHLSSGLYYAIMKTDDFNHTINMMLLRE